MKIFNIYYVKGYRPWKLYQGDKEFSNHASERDAICMALTIDKCALIYTPYQPSQETLVQ